MHAERCPVCGGTGRIVTLPHLTVPVTVQCHGCNGKGWVSVPDARDDLELLEAERDILHGRTKTFDNAEDLIRDLHGKEDDNAH